MNTILTDDERREIHRKAALAPSPVDTLIGETEAAVLAKLREQEPVAWTLTETLSKRETTTSAYLWFSNPVNSSWTPLYARPLPAVVQVPTLHRIRQHLANQHQYSKAEFCHKLAELLAAAPEAPAQGDENPLADHWREQYEWAFNGWEDCKRACDALRDQSVPAPWRESLRETLMAARRWHQGDTWRDDSTSEQRAAWEEHAANLDAAIAQLSDHTEQHLEMVPAPWREAVKVAREALQAMCEYTAELNPNQGFDGHYADPVDKAGAALAQLDALEGGK